MNKHLIIPFLLLLSVNLSSQNKYPQEVSAVLSQTKTNRAELEKALNHFNKPNDSLKLKAAYFLISNMDIHSSESYYWADSLGRKVEFDELQYPDFTTSLQAFDSIKKTVAKIHPVPYTYRDIDTITAAFLIDNINIAFELWQQPLAKNISFYDFCEYLLPYRITIEPVQDWRQQYRKRFVKYIQAYNNTDTILLQIKKDLIRWFICTYHLEKRADPLPRLGSLQLLLRKKGPCEDVADLGVFTLRSIGIPATIDYVPAWATSSGNHTLNAAFDSGGKPVHYDLLYGLDSVYDFIREPAKVIRTVYSKQANTLPYFENINNIPPGYMQLTNYKDVTAEYWMIADIACKLFTPKTPQRIVYATTLSYAKWEPSWWGIINKDSVVFTSMCKGAVFLPMYYINNKLVPAGYPVASGYKYSKVLAPDILNKKSITIKEQEHFLRFRPGKKYKLYYWNNKWNLIGEKVTDEKTSELVFNNVPKNALYILIPEYSQGKERPFTFNEKEEREWW